MLTNAFHYDVSDHFDSLETNVRPRSHLILCALLPSDHDTFSYESRLDVIMLRRMMNVLPPTLHPRCPSNKKPNSAVTALVICPGGTSVVVGCWDGSTHGMKVSPGGMGVEHLWSNPTGAANASIVAINVSMDGQVRQTEGAPHHRELQNWGVFLLIRVVYGTVRGPTPVGGLGHGNIT